jgi:hypothetical protein
MREDNQPPFDAKRQQIAPETGETFSSRSLMSLNTESDQDPLMASAFYS